MDKNLERIADMFGHQNDVTKQIVEVLNEHTKRIIALEKEVKNLKERQ